MHKAPRIGVIGAGIFGSLVAIELSRNGAQVKLFEKNAELLSGATSNSQNRLHLGLHYPRDVETAMQSVRGFSDFSSRFPESIYKEFNNYYSLAKHNSKVTKDEFLAFCNTAGIRIEDHFQAPEKFLANDEIFGELIKCEEAVIDMNILKKLLEIELKEFSVDCLMNTSVKEVNSKDDKFELRTEAANYKFDYIIRATYGADNIMSRTMDLHKQEFEYQNTVIAVLESKEAPFGFTVIDGDYLTILPYGKTGRFLAYAPSKSTLNKIIARGMPQSELFQVKKNTYSQSCDEIIERVREYLPAWAFSHNGDYLSAVRTIRLETKLNDRRTSHVLEDNLNFFDIWSGKIDHSVEIARELVSRIIERDA